MALQNDPEKVLKGNLDAILVATLRALAILDSLGVAQVQLSQRDEKGDTLITLTQEQKDGVSGKLTPLLDEIKEKSSALGGKLQAEGAPIK